MFLRLSLTPFALRSWSPAPQSSVRPSRAARDGFPVATLRLTDLLKAPAAQAAGAEVQILQVGGPIPQPKPIDGVLAQLTIDELVLAGDEVIVLANYRTDLGVFQALPGAGVYFERNGRVVPEDSNRFGAALLGRVRRTSSPR